MSKQTLTKEEIINKFTFYSDENSKLPKWHIEELEKTEEKIKNWEIKYLDSEEVDKRIMNYLQNSSSSSRF